MITLSGYDIHELLHTGTRSTVFRARRFVDQQPVILKIPAPEFPSREDLNRLRHEFSIGRAIDNRHVIHYDAIEDYHHGLALVEEDFGAVAKRKTSSPSTNRCSTLSPIPSRQDCSHLDRISYSGFHSDIWRM